MAQTIVEEPAIQESSLSCSCGCEQVHETAPEMPDEELLYDLADLFKVFADTTRIKILYTLMGRELSVGDLAEVIGATTHLNARTAERKWRPPLRKSMALLMPK